MIASSRISCCAVELHLDGSAQRALEGQSAAAPYCCRIIWNSTMTFVTLKILEGIEKGKEFSRLTLPITIGRESDSDVQLNDDRISRAHVKLQDHSGRVILTDLGSTNGTRVNGHPVQMRVMQPGDVLLVGRCSLLFTQPVSDEPLTSLNVAPKTVEVPPDFDDSMDVAYGEPSIGVEPGELNPNGRPPLPENLTALQRVQLSDLLTHLQYRLGMVIKGSVEDLHASARTIRCDWDTWGMLTSLQFELSQDIRAICNPDE